MRSLQKKKRRWRRRKKDFDMLWQKRSYLPNRWSDFKNSKSGILRTSIRIYMTQRWRRAWRRSRDDVTRACMTSLWPNSLLWSWIDLTFVPLRDVILLLRNVMINCRGQQLVAAVMGASRQLFNRAKGLTMALMFYSLKKPITTCLFLFILHYLSRKSFVWTINYQLFNITIETDLKYAKPR